MQLHLRPAGAPAGGGGAGGEVLSTFRAVAEDYTVLPPLPVNPRLSQLQPLRRVPAAAVSEHVFGLGDGQEDRFRHTYSCNPDGESLLQL